MKSQTRNVNPEVEPLSEENAQVDVALSALDQRLDSGEVSAREREPEIRELAYYLWLEEGCPDGRHLEHWERAAAIVLMRTAK
jgi:hypothetical protein